MTITIEKLPFAYLISKGFSKDMLDTVFATSTKKILINNNLHIDYSVNALKNAIKLYRRVYVVVGGDNYSIELHTIAKERHIKRVKEQKKAKEVNRINRQNYKAQRDEYLSRKLFNSYSSDYFNTHFVPVDTPKYLK
jgi:hypothetical protein